MNYAGAHAGNPYAGLVFYSTLTAGIVALLLLTNWPTYHYSIRGGPIALWYYALPVALVIPVVCAHPALAARYLKDPLTWWFLMYVLSGLIWLLLAQDFIEDASRQWRLRVLAFALFYSIAILTTNVNRLLLAFVIVACILIASAGNWLDILRPFRFVPKGIEGAHSGRGAGFFINPNVAASFIAMATIVVLPFVPMRFRAVILLCAVVGIAPTFSRSGFLYAGMLLVGSVMLKLLNRVQATILLLAVPMLIAATVFSYDFLMSASDDANLHNIVRRLEWFQGLGEEDQAVEGRKIGAQQAWLMFLEEPLTGRGLAATLLESAGMEGPHNMYLMLMGEQGLFGLFLYATLIWCFIRRGRRLATTAINKQGQDVGNAMLLYAAFLFAYGFFSHNVLEEAQSIFIMAFMAAAAAGAPRAAVWAPAPAADFHRDQATRDVRAGLRHS